MAKIHRHVRAALLYDVWVVSGKERTSGAPLTLLFSGSLENKNYLAHLSLAGTDEERHQRVPFWRLGRLLRRHADALTIVERKERPKHTPAGTVYIPCWIGGEIDLAKAELLRRTSGQVNADMRRIRKRSYEMAVERGSERLLAFYEEMYRPYLRNVYGARAFAASRSEVEAKAGIAELVLVREQGEPVAGQILVYENDRARGWLIGVRNGDRRYVREGAIAAVYQYTTRYLAGRGFERVHAGASRPFLNDGVLRYKGKWGMRITDHAPKWFAMTLPTAGEAALSFLTQNPFVYEIEDKYYAALFVRDRYTPPRPATVDALKIGGLAGVAVFRPAGGDRAQDGWNAAAVERRPAD